jgi:hypothetical protein
VLLTFDQNLEHQQNFAKYPISVFVLIAENNTYLVLRGLVEIVKSELAKPLTRGAIKIKRQTE